MRLSLQGVGGIPSGDAQYQGVSCYGADGAALEGGGATGDASSCNFTGPYLWETFSSGGANGHPVVKVEQVTTVAAVVVALYILTVAQEVAVGHHGLTRV